MTSYRLVVTPHWRPQMRDIVRTMRDVAMSGGDGDSLEIVGLRRGAPAIAAARTDGLSILLSDDDEPKLVARLARAGRGPHRVRVWWNTPEEIAAYLRTGRGFDDTHVCFFRDGWAALDAGDRTSVAVVPYAFTTPIRESRPAPPSGVWYAAEVDVSDAGLQTAVPPSSVSAFSARLWELARAVVAGDMTMVHADQRLQVETSDAPNLYRAGLWALRNRTRYLLVEGVVAAFPGRVRLRGDDWIKLGFEAEPTKFRRWRRLSEYQESRVALDLGSKSTNSWLYPRVADILAAAAGLVQFDSGEGGGMFPGLSDRRGRSLDELIAIVDRVLSLSGEAVTADNRRLYDGYSSLRLDAGRQLTQAVVQGTARRPSER